MGQYESVSADHSYVRLIQAIKHNSYHSKLCNLDTWKSHSTDQGSSPTPAELLDWQRKKDQNQLHSAYYSTLIDKLWQKWGIIGLSWRPVKQNALFSTVTATQRVTADYCGTARCEVCRTIWTQKFFVSAIASHYPVLSETQRKETSLYSMCTQHTERAIKRGGVQYTVKLLF